MNLDKAMVKGILQPIVPTVITILIGSQFGFKVSLWQYKWKITKQLLKYINNLILHHY